MTKPREKSRDELTAEIEDGKKKIRQYENREKMLRQKLSCQEHRTRSHRLIVRGAVFESDKEKIIITKNIYLEAMISRMINRAILVRSHQRKSGGFYNGKIV